MKRRQLARRRPNGPGPPEVRSISTDGSGSFTGNFSLPTMSGVTVTPHTALTIAALWNAVNIYGNAIAGLKLYIAEHLGRGGRKPALDNPIYDLLSFTPNPMTTSFRFRQSGVGHVMTHGNWYSEIERDRNAIPVALHLLDPKNTEPRITEGSHELVYELVREKKILKAKDVLHIAGLGWDGVKGYSPVSMARETLGLAIAEQSHTASLMGNNAAPTGHLEYPGKLADKAKGTLRDNWNKIHQGPDRKGNLAILDGGLKWVMESFSPADTELILSRGFSIAEIARIYNLPQHMLGLLDHATFSNIEEQNLAFYQLSLWPWLENIEQELNKKLLTPDDRRIYVVCFDPSNLLRGNTAARTAYYDSLFDKGALSPNEIRIREGLNPIDDPAMDLHYIPVNNLQAIETLGKTDDAPTADATPGALPAPPAEADVADVQATALNGAQIASLLSITQQVAEGLLPLDSAKGLIAASFPTLSAAQIDAIVGSLAGFTPKVPGAPEPSEPPASTDALRALLLDPIGRMIRQECEAARRASKRDRFDLWAEDFFPKHALKVGVAIEPAIRAAELLTGRTISHCLIADQMAANSRNRFQLLAKTIPPDELPGAVDRSCAEWESTRAEALVQLILKVAS
jgi:HK97 family phage portal protein